MARAAVDSWRYSGGGSGIGSGGGNSRGSGDGSGGGSASGGSNARRGPYSEQSPRVAPAACVLDEISSHNVAVYALELAQLIMTLHPASSGKGWQGLQGSGGTGSGASGSGASGSGASGSGASGSDAAGSDAAGMLSESPVGGDEFHEDCGCKRAGGAARAGTWLSWAVRRRLADTWWRLVVAAVHMELEVEGGGRRDPRATLAAMRKLLGAAVAVPYGRDGGRDATGGRRMMMRGGEMLTN